jgi:hypothetical protein
MRFWGHYYAFHYYKDNGLVAEATQALPALLAFKNRLPASLWKALKMEEAVVNTETATA